jgi:snRNA-activating protein complex subunit 3
MRYDNNTDYSKNFIDWVNERRRYLLPGVGICNTRKMEETTFLDLSIKVGQPYLYVHQGSFYFSTFYISHLR